VAALRLKSRERPYVVLRDWATNNNEEERDAIEPKRRRCQPW
jgi:hypothetical protein